MASLYWLLKNEMGSQVAIEKLQEHIRALLKNRERFAICTKLLKTQNEIQKLDESLHKNLK